MKKSIVSIFILFLALPTAIGQSFFDDFESYSVNDTLSMVSSKWTTYSGSTTGSPEDVLVVNDNSYSGRNAIYCEPFSGTYRNMLLSFDGVHDSGTFIFSTMMYVPGGSEAYFNMPSTASAGWPIAVDCYMATRGWFYMNNLWGTYPADRWFELKIKIDFSATTWDLYFDNVFQGSFTPNATSVSFFNFQGWGPYCSFWLDDVSYCSNSSCNTDISMEGLTINPNPLCTDYGAAVQLRLKNNGPDEALGFRLGMDMAGQPRINYNVVLDKLQPGKDTTITIPGLFKTHIPGNNLKVWAVNASHDRNILNDTITTVIDIVPGPSGSSFIPGVPFEGRSDLGIVSKPDLITVGKTNTYEIVPPTGYINADHSSSWNIYSVELRTKYGIIVPPSDYTVTLPTSTDNATVAFTGADAYIDSVITISANINNMPGNCDSFIYRVFKVVPSPKVDFSIPSVFCSGREVNFENNTTIHSGYATYMWYFGDNDSSDHINPVHTYSLPGTYTVTLVAKSFPYGIIEDSSVTITVNELPVTNFVVKNKCEGVAVDFFNQSTAGSGTMSHTWDFGDASSIDTAVNTSHIYSSPGKYRVKLVSSINGCSDTLVKNAYTFARPVPDFTAPSVPVCSKTEILLKNTSTIALGSQGAIWDFGDGGINDIYDAKYTYAGTGTYQVKLVMVSEFGCKDSIVKPVIIKATPSPDFTGDKFCSKTATIFTNRTVEDIANPAYTWTFSDGFTSGLKNVSRSWPGEGSFTVNLKADYSNGCSGNITRTVVVKRQVKANFNAQNICAGETAKFVNTSMDDKNDIQFAWDFGNGMTSSVRSPEVVYGTSGIYPVSLITVNATGCNDTFVKNITVNENPVCGFTHTDMGFMNIRFTPTNASYQSYEWYFGDGDSSVLINPEHKYNQKNSFDVTMRAINSLGCSCEMTKRIYTSTGIHSVSNSQISVYPNPNRGIFTVKHAEGAGISVEIFNSLGMRVYNDASDNGQLTANLENKADGIYFMKISLDGLTETRQIVLSR